MFGLIIQEHRSFLQQGMVRGRGRNFFTILYFPHASADFVPHRVLLAQFLRCFQLPAIFPQRLPPGKAPTRCGQFPSPKFPASRCDGKVNLPRPSKSPGVPSYFPYCSHAFPSAFSKARKSPSSQNNQRRFNIDRQDAQDEILILSILCIDVK